MLKKEVEDLLLKYQSGQCSEEERTIVENWLFYENKTDFNLSDQELAQNLNELDFRMGLAPKVKKHNFIRTFAAAAAILLISCVGLYFYTSAPTNTTISNFALKKAKDIEPGGNFAMLTLANGKSFNLNSSRDRVLIKKDSLSIVNTENGQLIYLPNNELGKLRVNNSSNLFAINTLSTPRGGQYQVSLPDGTKVWLNSASSLKFPARFIGDERRVQLTGEAYFEVAKNPKMPFKVTVNSTTVKVLGTHFNINAYDDMPSIKTTLLEGSIQITNGSIHKILKPNEQGLIDKSGSMKVMTADTEKAIAWKNGYFIFNRTSLHEIMQQISRWYNVEVVYKGEISSEEDLAGKIKRNSNLSKTLKLLEFSGVHFEVNDHKVIVTTK